MVNERTKMAESIDAIYIYTIFLQTELVDSLESANI